MKDILGGARESGVRWRAHGGGGEARVEAQHRRGKLTARERLDVLIDNVSFEEFDMFVSIARRVRHGRHRKIPGDGVVTGWGTMNGRRFRFRQDFTVFGGCHETHAQKIQKVQDMAMRTGADRRPLRCRRGAHPGRRGGARRLWRSISAQRDRLRRDPADLGDHGPMRRRRRLFAGDDRLHLHGEEHELHVRHPAPTW